MNEHWGVVMVRIQRLYVSLVMVYNGGGVTWLNFTVRLKLDKGGEPEEIKRQTKRRQ